MTTNQVLGDMNRKLDLHLPVTDRMKRINRKLLLQDQAKRLAEAYEAGELRAFLDKAKGQAKPNA